MRLLAMCVVALSASAAQARVTVDPDAFAVGTNISHAFPGVTLSAVGSGGSGVSGSVFAGNPALAAEPFTPSTGSLAFASDDPSYPYVWREAGFLQMRADFASPVSIVMLDFIGNDAAGTTDTGVLFAYDAGGNLLDSATTAALLPNHVGALTVTSAGGIAYMLAGGDDFGSSIGLDNLRYEPATIPAPAALVLSGIGLGLVRYLRGRKTL
jgi:hypothetical protein